MTLKVKYANHQRTSRRETLGRATTDGRVVGPVAIRLLGSVPEIEQRGGLPGAIKRLFKKTAAPVSAESQAQIGKKKHLSIVTQFESFLRGIESSLKTAGLKLMGIHPVPSTFR